LRERLSAIEQAGARLLAIDPHESWSAKFLLDEVGLSTADVSYPLLADAADVVSAAYGIAFQMRIHTEWSNRPATFIIDRDGTLRYARRGRSFADRPSPQVVLRELEKLR